MADFLLHLWGAADLAVPRTIGPDGIPSEEALGTPVVVGGLTPNGIPSAEMLGTPIVSEAGVVSVFAYDNNDTIRGGKEIVLAVRSGIQVADTSLDQSFANLQALPGSWASTGGTQIFELGATVLETGPAAGNSAGIELAGDPILHGDIAVDFELRTPKAIAVGRRAEVARFQIAAAGATATITVERVPDEALVVTSSMTAFGRTTIGQGMIVADETFTLRIVRNAGRMFLFYGQRGSDRVYESLTLLLSSNQFEAVTPGIVSIQCSNLTYATNVRTAFRNFTVESHARIAGRLLDDKVVRFRRVIGDVPAATLEEVGFVELAVFGLFGEESSPEGFEYTLPVPRTVGRERDRTLLYFGDVQLRDGGD